MKAKAPGNKLGEKLNEVLAAEEVLEKEIWVHDIRERMQPPIFESHRKLRLLLPCAFTFRFRKLTTTGLNAFWNALETRFRNATQRDLNRLIESLELQNAKEIVYSLNGMCAPNLPTPVSYTHLTLPTKA